MKALEISNVASVTVAIDSKATLAKEASLASLREIQTVSDEFMQGVAVDAIRDARALLAHVEKSRVEIKAPVLELGRKIDKLAKDFSDPIAFEVNRANRLVTDFTVEQRRKAEAEEQRRIAEQARLEAEKRKAQEVAAAPFTTEEAATAKQTIAAVETQIKSVSAPVAPPPKPQGLAVKDVWRFEVVDIHAVYKHSASLVRLEANAQEINNAIRNGLRECPGLKIWRETVTEVRR